MLTDFQNSFTGRLTGKFATNSYLNIPPHLKSVATLLWWSLKWDRRPTTTRLPCEISMFKKSQFLRSIWSKLPCKTSPTQKTVLKYLVKYFLVNSLITDVHASHIKYHYRLYTIAETKKNMLQQNAVHDQQSVSYWWHKSVSKSKLVYSSLVFCWQ